MLRYWRWRRNSSEYWFHTMSKHFRAYHEAGNRSPGVFLIPQSIDIGRAIDELLLIWLASEASEWANRLEWLPL